ncbi:MAG: hypothetical protein M1835_003792 [Candelina submexicana]|nr:MAG: hypothetical protein M1835_003792 [Candelina submexicana]
MLALILSILIACSRVISSTPDDLDFENNKHLVKRPVAALTRHCSRNYGYPEYNDCGSAIAQLPTWSSRIDITDLNGEGTRERNFREHNGPMLFDIMDRLPLRRSFVLISGVHSLEELEIGNVDPAAYDSENWWTIIETANQINQACVLTRTTGGGQTAGNERGILVSLYEFDSRADEAVTDWIEEESNLPVYIYIPPNGVNGAAGTRYSINPPTVNQDQQWQGLNGLSQAAIERAGYCVLGVGKCMGDAKCKSLASEESVIRHSVMG